MRALFIAPLVAVKLFVAGSKVSAVASVAAVMPPPVMRTLPLDKDTAAWPERTVVMEAARSVNELVDGSKSSALESDEFEFGMIVLYPPATKTFPFGS